MKIVFCSSEVVPFAKTGGLGDVCGSLPLALEKLGIDVTIVMPGYACVAQSGLPVDPVTSNISRSRIGQNIPVYFIEHDDYFARDGLYGEENKDYPDNFDRFRYYCDETLKLLRQIDLKPDVIHCHDWQSALIPVMLKEQYADDVFFEGTRSMLTIHNLAFQGAFPREHYDKLGLESPFAAKSFEFYDRISLLKAGIVYSDKVTTVSRQYAQEIQTKAFGCGLEHVLRERYDGVLGIVNGLDHDIWDPRSDPHIARNYGADDFDDAKLANKMQLQKELGIDVRDDTPLFGFVGRLSHQKGVDLIFELIDEMVAMDVQAVFLGIGDGEYQKRLVEAAGLYAEHIAARFDFSEPLGHQIYAGSDLFLMPSRFEPCGLSQMISLRYGTVPVVFKTGGLADTVMPYGALHKDGNGFVFNEYTHEAFLKSLRKAVKVFGNDKEFHHLRQNAMNCDFSWEKSARVYQDIYQTIESGRFKGIV